MANKVVQLIDKDSNNIFPVAGALKDGSVTTSTISNGAVTSAKIDFTTFYGPAMSVATRSFDIGFDRTATLTRVGNIVIVSSETTVHNYADVHSRLQLNEIVPLGYRPISTSIFHGMTQDYTNANDDGLSWEVDTDGNMFLSNRAGNTRFILHGVWVTSDPWPSS